jgi:hypothetical protein
MRHQNSNDFPRVHFGYGPDDVLTRQRNIMQNNVYVDRH